MSKPLIPDWTASTEGTVPDPPTEVTETNIPGQYEVTLTVAQRPVAEGRIAHGLQLGHTTHQ